MGKPLLPFGYAMRLAGLLTLVSAAGCRPTDEPGAPPPAAPRVEDLSQAPVTVKLKAEPGKVDFTRDVLLTLTVSAPAEIEVRPPSLDGRLAGFALSGMFDREPVREDGRTVLERRARLTPLVADEYRLAPLAIVYTDHSRSPARQGWFATRPVVFEAQPPAAGPAAGDIRTGMQPIWIYPPARTVLLWVAAALAGAALLALLGYGIRHIRNEARLRRMSPQERALHELEALLRKDLVRRERVKDFYLELTMIVRRYIERAYAIRAPEQTTEEFLAAVAGDRRFPEGTLRVLRAFLQAADLVKFAAHRPDAAAVDNATGTARDYIQTDGRAREEAGHV